MIPNHLENSLLRYQNEHCPTGGFLRAVLENDLRDVCFKADAFNAPIIIDIVRWCHSNLSMECYGSPKIVKDWLSKEKDE